MLEKLEQAEHFIFLEFFIIAQGQIWDRMAEIFRRKAAEGVEVKIIFDDFGSMMRFPAGQIEALRESGVEVQVFNPVHHYVNRLYFNYRDHRKSSASTAARPTPAEPTWQTNTPTLPSVSAIGRTAASGWTAPAHGA